MKKAAQVNEKKQKIKLTVAVVCISISFAHPARAPFKQQNAAWRFYVTVQQTMFLLHYVLYDFFVAVVAVDVVCIFFLPLITVHLR